MVYVKVPQPVELVERTVDNAGNLTRKPIRAMRFVEVIDWLTNDTYFSKPSSRGKVAAELLADFEKAEPGDYVRLTSEQHAHIKAVLETPSSPMHSMVLKQIVPFLDALLEPLSEKQFSERERDLKSEC